MSGDRRVEFDFEIDFSNGGGIQGRRFRLDIPTDSVSDEEVADAIVRELGLLMVEEVRILNKRIIREPHKRPSRYPGLRAPTARPRRVELSHQIEDGMVTYPGLPAPSVSPHLTREASRSHYAAGTEFYIGKISMVGNTGTYIDAPFHRFASGADIGSLPLHAVADLDAVVVSVTGMNGRAISRAAFLPHDVDGRAVLVHTGWAERWGTDAYFEGHPFLVVDAAEYLRDAGAALVGIDSLNIDDTSGGERPVHTTLLRSDIPVVEHLCGLEALPIDGFRFSAVPAPVRGIGTFPVRAYAILDT